MTFVLRRSVVIKPRQGCLVGRGADSRSDIVPAGSYRTVTLGSVVVVAASVPLSDGDSSQGRKLIDISGSVNDVDAALSIPVADDHYILAAATVAPS